MRIITFSILDILLFSIIFYIFNFELNYILVVILGTWSISSYIMGRYSFGKFKNIDKLKYAKRV